jgi:hypothetical protein
MREWTARMEKAGAVLVTESLIVNEKPDGDDVWRCKNFGATLAG